MALQQPSCIGKSTLESANDIIIIFCGIYPTQHTGKMWISFCSINENRLFWDYNHHKDARVSSAMQRAIISSFSSSAIQCFVPTLTFMPAKLRFNAELAKHLHDLKIIIVIIRHLHYDYNIVVFCMICNRQKHFKISHKSWGWDERRIIDRSIHPSIQRVWQAVCSGQMLGKFKIYSNLWKSDLNCKRTCLLYNFLHEMMVVVSSAHTQMPALKVSLRRCEGCFILGILTLHSMLAEWVHSIGVPLVVILRGLWGHYFDLIWFYCQRQANKWNIIIFLRNKFSYGCSDGRGLPLQEEIQLMNWFNKESLYLFCFRGVLFVKR